MLGLVTNIYRDGHPRRPDGAPAVPVVDAIFGTPSEKLTVTCPYSGDEPPPLSVCRFSDEPVPVCEGPVDVRVDEVLLDHFTRVPTTAAGATTIACDTPWVCSISTGGGIQQTGSTYLGAATLFATGAASRITLMRKDDTALALSAADALWASFRLNATTTQQVIQLGLANNALTRYVLVDNTAVASATAWRLVNDNGAGGTGASSATTNAGGAHTFDLVLVPGVVAMVWVDGDGPYFSTSSIPTTSDAVEPFFRVVTLSTTPVVMNVDYYRLVAIHGPIANPTTDPLLAVT